MADTTMDFPEVNGKVLAGLSVREDIEFGREVLLRFTDKTQLSIAVGVKQVVDARYCDEEMPDQPTALRQS